MIHIHVESYDSKDRPVHVRLELDSEMRPLVARVLEAAILYLDRIGLAKANS